MRNWLFFIYLFMSFSAFASLSERQEEAIDFASGAFNIQVLEIDTEVGKRTLVLAGETHIKLTPAHIKGLHLLKAFDFLGLEGIGEKEHGLVIQNRYYGDDYYSKYAVYSENAMELARRSRISSHENLKLELISSSYNEIREKYGLSKPEDRSFLNSMFYASTMTDAALFGYVVHQDLSMFYDGTGIGGYLPDYLKKVEKYEKYYFSSSALNCRLSETLPCQLQNSLLQPMVDDGLIPPLPKDSLYLNKHMAREFRTTLPNIHRLSIFLEIADLAPFGKQCMNQCRAEGYEDFQCKRVICDPTTKVRNLRFVDMIKRSFKAFPERKVQLVLVGSAHMNGIQFLIENPGQLDTSEVQGFTTWWTKLGNLRRFIGL